MKKGMETMHEMEEDEKKGREVGPFSCFASHFPLTYRLSFLRYLSNATLSPPPLFPHLQVAPQRMVRATFAAVCMTLSITGLLFILGRNTCSFVPRSTLVVRSFRPSHPLFFESSLRVPSVLCLRSLLRFMTIYHPSPDAAQLV